MAAGYLVGAGAGRFAFEVFMFEVLAGRFAFEVIVFDVLEGIVFDGIVFDIFDVFIAFAGRALALLAGAASPHAIPRALKAKSVDRAIAFFITCNSPVFSRDQTKFARRGGLAPKLFLFLEQTKSYCYAVSKSTQIFSFIWDL